MSSAITGELDSGEDNWLLRCANQRERFAECRFERVRIGLFRLSEMDSRNRNFAVNDVMRDLDVNRTLVAQTRFDAADNLRSRALFIEENRARNRDFVVNAALCLESFDLVMKKRIFFAIFPSGRAADNDNRRFLSISA